MYQQFQKLYTFTRYLITGIWAPVSFELEGHGKSPQYRPEKGQKHQHVSEVKLTIRLCTISQSLQLPFSYSSYNTRGVIESNSLRQNVFKDKCKYG